MTTNFQFTNNGYVNDTDDLFIRRDLFSSGGLWLWGHNQYGQLGDNTTAAKSSPVQTIAGGTNWKQVAAHYKRTAAIKTDGTLWTWGYNNSGDLGDGTTAAKSSPVQTVAAGTNWRQVAVGLGHIAAIKTDGTLWTWGLNQYGQLGDGTRGNKSSPVQTTAGGTNWRQVAAGDYQTAVIKTDGTLWLWGDNANGALGDNTVAPKSSPIQTISGGTNWRIVSFYGGGPAAIKTDGTLWLWGYNGIGGIGDGTTVTKSSPVQTIAGGTNWLQVSGGGGTAAIKTDGTLWLWGYNGFGALGNNTITHRSSPVQTIAGGTNWRLVSAGQYHTAAIKTDGTLWTWGHNASFFVALGDNTQTHKSSPVQTVAGGTNWKLVAAGAYHTAAIQDNS